MTVMQSYQDLCKEIDILETRLRDLEREYTFLYKQGWTNGNKRPIMGMGLIIERLEWIIEEFKTLEQVLQWKYETKEEMEKKINQLEGLDYKVAYMRDIKGMPLIEIAAELGYSYDWIKKISAKTQRRHQEGTL